MLLSSNLWFAMIWQLKLKINIYNWARKVVILRASWFLCFVVYLRQNQIIVKSSLKTKKLELLPTMEQTHFQKVREKELLQNKVRKEITYKDVVHQKTSSCNSGSSLHDRTCKISAKVSNQIQRLVHNSGLIHRR